MHDDPRLPDKSRFEWIGSWIKEERPDVVVQIGDWGTFDSLSMHAKPGTFDAQNNPSWESDLKSLEDSIAAVEAGLAGFSCPKYLTEGNHENRTNRYENSDPRLVGSLTTAWQSLFLSRGWEIIPFGEYLMLSGVGIIHHPISAMGKAFGGVTGNQRAGSAALFSIIHGHDHKLEIASCAKLGQTDPVEVMSIGCTLPEGHVEAYARISATGWWRGVVKVVVQDGRILDKHAVSMVTLERLYGQKGERWRPVPGFEEFEISSIGNVRHLKYTPIMATNAYGYKCFCLPKGSKPKKMMAHVAVCLAFHGPKPNGKFMQVGHLNGKRADNRVENLKWVSAEENSFHRKLHGTQQMGENHHSAKFTWVKIKKMREMGAEGILQREIAKKFGTHQSQVTAILSNKAWYDPNYKPQRRISGPRPKDPSKFRFKQRVTNRNK